MHRFTLVAVLGFVVMMGALSCAEHSPTGLGASPDPRLTLGPELLAPGESALRSSTTLQVMRSSRTSVDSIAVSLRESALRVGDTTRASAVLSDANGRLLSGRSVSWSSSNSAVASVTPSGRVRAIAKGTASIVAHWRSISGSATLTVGSAAAPASAAQLFVSRQPAGAESGRVLSTQPVIQLRDASGAIASASTARVTASLTSGDATLSGTTRVDAVDGVASFTDLRLDGAGAQTLTFTASGLTSAVASVTVTQTPAALAIQTQPGGARTGSPLASQPVVRILDNAGRLIATSSLVVSASVASGSATLTGRAATAAGGVATFADLRVDGSGTATLAFSTNSPSLRVTSAPFTVAADAPAPSPTAPTTPGAACPNEPPGYVTINEQPWDVVPVHPNTSLGWIDDYWNAGTAIPVVSDPTSPFPSTNHNVAAGTFPAGSPGGSSPFFIYRPFASTEQYRNIYICLYLKHSADFDNTNGNTGTKFLWPAADQVQGTQTYNGHDGANMDFQFFQQGAVDRRLGANMNTAAARCTASAVSGCATRCCSRPARPTAARTVAWTCGSTACRRTTTRTCSGRCRARARG